MPRDHGTGVQERLAFMDRLLPLYSRVSVTNPLVYVDAECDLEVATVMCLPGKDQGHACLRVFPPGPLPVRRPWELAAEACAAGRCASEYAHTGKHDCAKHKLRLL
jgi:hypothetical protein